MSMGSWNSDIASMSWGARKRTVYQFISVRPTFSLLIVFYIVFDYDIEQIDE